MSTDINDTLTERGGRYGPFKGNAEIAQALKALIRTYPGFLNLSPPHAEALDMVMVKVSRILNGDPNYADNWHDIAGFATLAERECAPTPSAEKPLGPGDVLHMPPGLNPATPEGLRYLQRHLHGQQPTFPRGNFW